MANEEMKGVQRATPMVGGDGLHSYAKNSIYQKVVMDIAKGLLKEGIRDHLDLENQCLNNLTTFRIVDLGCSTGTNTIFAINNIIEAVRDKYNSQVQNTKPLEFQVFFNDLYDNDFNTLFKELRPFQEYFAVAVPGSFYTRLFPKSSIHLVHSSYSLHWLSKVPTEILDSSSPAWNKGSIYCTGLSHEVVNAYLAQYKTDTVAFLNARAEEIVDGGLIAIVVPGRPNGVLTSQTRPGIFSGMLGSCLIDMANSGEVSVEKVDSFNLPMHYTSPKELQDIIEENGHFGIERMEEMIHPFAKTKPAVELCVAFLRTIFEGLLKEHFGNEEFINKVFERYTYKLKENYFMMGEVVNSIELFILLKRNFN